MMKTTANEGFKRSESEKKMISSHFDVDFRISKVQTANRVKGNSPMELLTRKLQWRGREVKRMVPYTSDNKNARLSPVKEEQR